MTVGALIFAFNNEQTDYVSLAAWNAKNIQRHLGIPTAIVTDVEPGDPRLVDVDKIIAATPEAGGMRWFNDYQSTSTWYNASRTDAFELTPWTRTLVLDADYVVASNQLGILLDSDQEFLAHSQAFDVTGTNSFVELNHYGEYRMPMSWATVMIFDRNKHTELIFDSMKMIKNNWQHYKDLYRATSSIYRNDYSLSIALNMVAGQTLQYPAIPWSLATVTPDHRVSKISEDFYRIDYQDLEHRPRWITIQNHDFHVLGKQDLEKIIETY